MTISYMNAEARGIGLLIEQEREFAVPDHQRDYAWGADEVGQLLLDVERALDEEADDYFLGLIVLVKEGENGPLQILDGQQRLATTTMIYAGIREWLHAAGQEKDAQKVQSDHVGLLSLGDTEDRPRLTLNITDRAIFQELVVDRANDATLEQRRDAEGRYSSSRKVADAALICRQRVAEYAQERGEDSNARAGALYRLAEYLRDKVKVVTMNVSSESNAYIIFESLNDRGLDLSVLDLVKNHLFGRASSKLDAVKHNWSQMTAHLRDRSADDFLKVFWTSRYGRIQRGKLFQEWRKLFDALTPTKVEKLTADLVVAADRFAALDTPDDDLWRDYSQGFRNSIRDLALIGNRQMRPVILAALDRFSPSQLETLVRTLLVVTFRYQNVGKQRTGALEIAGARTAKAIATGNVKTPAAAWKELSSIAPSDEDFRDAFIRYVESTPRVAKYVLRCLEVEARTRDGGKFSELSPSEHLSLEHILPQNPGNAWASVIDNDPELIDYTNRIGNLCLLSKGSNKSAGDKAFPAKASGVYAGSPLLLTASLKERYSEWDRAAIRDRQEWLASMAPSIWQLP